MSLTQQSRSKAFVFRNTRYLMLAGIVVIMALVFGLLNPKFYGFSNLMNIIRQTSILSVVSIGMTFVVLTGGIDLSVGSNIALSGALAAQVLILTGSTMLSIAAAIITGSLVGFVNGVLIGKLRISAFIATLAMQTTARGATMMITNAGALRVDNPIYYLIGQENVFGLVPVMFLLVIALFTLFARVCSNTLFGRRTYAVGGNPTASKASGIQVERHLISVYVLAGVMAGIASIITVGRVSSAQPWAGINVEFDVITAVVLGGTSLIGGVGSLIGTMFGAVIMGIISNGMGLINIDPYLEYILKGLLVFAAVYLDMTLFRLYKQRLTPAITKNESQQQREPDNLHTIKNSKYHLLSMQSITKTFPGMKALDEVSLMVKPGQIHALLGENGAGKSTLMKILAGEVQLTSGEIRIDGQYIDINSVNKADLAGIAMIHQEFSHVRELTVAQNLFLGRELKSAMPGLVSRRKMEDKARELLSRLDSKIEPRKKVKELSVSEQQIVEIAKAMSKDAWLLILDEPTSSLTEEEKEQLFFLLRRMKQAGVSMIYITHRMQEIFEIADELTILRDGKFIQSGLVADFTEAEIIRLMVGRELNDIFNRNKTKLGEVVLDVRNLSRVGSFEPISFTVRSGEVLGFAGLMGAGRTEVMRSVFGLDQVDNGEVLINGVDVKSGSVQDAMHHGIVYVTEDRRLEGFIPYMSIKKNLCLPSYPSLQRLGTIDRAGEQEIADKYMDGLRIKTTSQDKNVIELSGGNQQKVSLGKWLALNPKVLILDEPTRGIDVGAKAEIHAIIERAAQDGMAIILISSELSELIGCVDRLVVLYNGRVSGELQGHELTQERIMELATNACIIEGGANESLL